MASSVSTTTNGATAPSPLAGTAGLLRAVENRARLASLELGEARTRILGCTAWLAGAAVVALLTGTAATLLIAAVYWDTEYRVPALTATTAIYALFALFAAFRARRHIKNWRPLEATAHQIEEDLACLRQHL